MVKVFREEPLFIKIRRKAQDFPDWFHLALPQGRYKVNAPLQHRLICKEAQLRPECDYDELYTTADSSTPPVHTFHDLKDNLGAPHNHLYLEATTATSVSTSHANIDGSNENDELLINSTKFAKLTIDMDVTDTVFKAVGNKMDEITKPVLWECNRQDNAYAFPLQFSDQTSLHLRVADCEGHTVARLTGTDAMFREDTMVELTVSLVYQVFVQDVELPQHPKEGFLGYYRNAINEPLANI